MPFPFVIEQLGPELSVLRDDKIEGGSKRRALDIMIPRRHEDHLAYAGTVMGHGALAFALSARDAGKTAHVFLSGVKDHPMTERLQRVGAHLHFLEPQPMRHLYERAQEWVSTGQGRHLYPPAFDMPEFRDAMREGLKDFDARPYSEIWTTSVSGTLTRALKTAFAGVPIKTVKVVKEDMDAADFMVCTAPEKYHQAAKEPPPYPACPYTDAKLWQFAHRHAAPGALIWNTAG